MKILELKKAKYERIKLEKIEQKNKSTRKQERLSMIKNDSAQLIIDKING